MAMEREPASRDAKEACPGRVFFPCPAVGGKTQRVVVLSSGFIIQCPTFQSSIIINARTAVYLLLHAKVPKATSHTRLKARDHCILRSLIGGKGRDCVSSLYARRVRPKLAMIQRNCHG